MKYRNYGEKLASAKFDDIENNECIKIGNVSFLGKVIQGVPPRELKNIVDGFKKEVGSGIVSVAGSFEKKASLVVGVTEDLAENMMRSHLYNMERLHWMEKVEVADPIWLKLEDLMLRIYQEQSKE